MKLKRNIRKVALKAFKILQNKDLVATWMVEKNDILGGTPLELIQQGRKGRVLKALEDYARFHHTRKI